MKNLKFPFELDANGEWVVLSDLDALKQKINQRLTLFSGSWFLDINRGVPYLTEILTKPVDPGIVASILNSEILKESEVTEINNVTVDLNQETRNLIYSAEVKTIYGSTEVTL